MSLIEILIYIYFYMWLVCGLAMMDYWKSDDMIRSALAAMFWPIALPVAIVRRIIK